MDYAISNRDKLFILSGEIGSGKSLIIQDLLIRLDDNTLAFRIHQTLLSNIEFLQMLLREFGIKSFHDRKVELLDQIYTFLVEQHRKRKQVVLIVDEAQNLAPDVMEEIRLLLEFEQDGDNLLNLFLIGQPGLNGIIDRPELEQLRQRARLRYHLDALDEEDVKNYIAHRLKVAGDKHTVAIDKDVYPLVHEYTGGRPRLINILMDQALTCAFVNSNDLISQGIILISIDELGWQPFSRPQEDIPDVMNSKNTDSVPGEESVIAASWKIMVYKNGRFISEYLLNKPSSNIGRHSDNDIVLKDPRISRLHAQLILNESEIFIQDMNSKNGIFNGENQVDLHALQPGDVITIASYELTFSCMHEEEREDITESVNIVQYPFQSRHKH